MMRDAVLSFHTQFAFEPVINNKEVLESHIKFLFAGMGGSHLAADILRGWDPSLDMIIWHNYGLPAIAEEALRARLFIANSYSGNTEETIDALTQALKIGMSCCAIAVGGKLLEIAQQRGLPYIQLPDTGIQPRSALGFSIQALCTLLGLTEAACEARALADTLKPQELESLGQALADRLHDKVPVIYSSFRNQAVAYNWKIKFNETGKIPAFYNTLPELNHNEMTGFDVQEASRHLSERFSFLFLSDTEDDPRVQRRMNVLEGLYRERGFPVEVLELSGQSRFYRMFASLVVADWTALSVAEGYGLESEQVPMVEEFKKLMR
ncbi:MAG: hypothetical protein A3G01_01900 [Candidatus Kerfeldbacteria bacterium RIFCSPLOWO2_12_FULL_43_9]|nr:MAG: hypothetical protein A3G01_01900 [Candidatus Kerfeldbacteria bacterium RIFCSPLOWO2_12_FULL_43_9]